MKNVFQLITVLLLTIQTLGYGQTERATTIQSKPVTTLQDTTIETEKFNDALGTFLLQEGFLELEIVQEEDKMYIVSEFSKDPLIQKNETTLREPTRGVDLELIKDNKDALKFTQNGYETIIKRVTKKD